MNDRDPVRTSKFLSLILRHEPAKFGVVLDEAGWTDVAVLLEACRKHGRAIDRALREQIVATNDKKRFSFDETGTRIRANQGIRSRSNWGTSPPRRLPCSITERRRGSWPRSVRRG